MTRSFQTLAATVVVLIWAAVAAGLWLIETTDETTNSLRTVIEAVADESIEITKIYLGEGESAGHMASSSLRDSGGEITAPLIETTLQNIVASHASVDGAFVGLPTGDFYYATKSATDTQGGLRTKRIQQADDPGRRSVVELQLDRTFQTVSRIELPDDRYDPRTRPWYTGALEQEVGWTAPYVFASSQEPGVTHYQEVRSFDGNFIGVVGIDIRLADLTDFLQNRVPSKNGEAVLLDADGAIVAGLPGSSLDDADRRFLAELALNQRDGAIITTELQLPQERQIAALATIDGGSDWSLAISSPDRDFLAGLASRMRLLFPILGLGLTVVVALATWRTLRRVEQLNASAMTDPLTGLLNRSEVRRRLADSLEGNTKVRIAAIAFDLDDFGRFNDELGHDVGDAVLVGLAGRVQSAVRNNGFVGRVGGDEFMAVIALEEHEDPVTRVANLASAVTGAPLRVDDAQLDLVSSAGIAVREPGERKGLETMLHEADLALLTAKANKPQIVAFSAEMAFPSLRDAKRAQELQSAIHGGELEYFFQPEIDLVTGEVVGAEALMRWRHQDGRVETADGFIADMERLDMIDLMTPRLVDACTELCSRVEIPDFTLRVNLAGSQLRNKQTLDLLEKSANESHARWCIEITEHSMAETTATSRERLEHMVQGGIDLALDDFGTGYSSLGELGNLPITTIKIDKSFVDVLTTNDAPASLTYAIIDIANRLSLDVVAEGIEHAEQQRALVGLGCRTGQGFLFGEAVPVDEFPLHHSMLNNPSSLN